MSIDVLASGAAFVLLGFVLGGGPMFLADWFRKRRQEEIARQIALTDAIDGQVGAIVAPVVRKPLFNPWEVQVAVPVDQSATVARILSVVDEVFSDVGRGGSRSYRIFLTAQPDPRREARAPGTPRSATRLAGNPIGAA
jgi:hypothetical protein